MAWVSWCPAPAQEWSKRAKRISLDVSNANVWLIKHRALLGGRLAARASAETSSYGLRYLPDVLLTMHTQPITLAISQKAKSCFLLCSGALRCAFVSSSKPATGILKRPSCRNCALGREYRWIAVAFGLSYNTRELALLESEICPP